MGIDERMQHARSASGEELAALLHDANPQTLEALLENPNLEEPHVLLLLERKNLPGRLLDSVARNKQWMRSYAVRLRVASHAHTPRLVAIRLVRQLYLFDLVRVSLLPSAPAELRRLAEDQLIAKMGQIALGQKLTLARRGSARVAGALLAEGHPQIVPLVLDNAFLTEAQVLKVLAKEDLPEVVPGAVAQHRKWQRLYNVRVALLRNPHTPLARVLEFLPDITLRDLKELSAAGVLSANLREYLRHEIAVRSRRRKRVAADED